MRDVRPSVFGAILIGSTAERSRVIKGAAVEAQRVLPLRTLESYPTSAHLIHLLNAVDPDLIFVDAWEAGPARECAGVASSRNTRSGVIAVGEPSRLAALEKDPLFRVTIGYPPASKSVSDAVDQVVHRQHGGVENGMVSILPAKAGSGASTAALNTAVALGAMGRRVLLMEVDLRSGVLATMAGIDSPYTITQLLKVSAEMDRFRVQNAIVRRHGVDMLLAGKGRTMSREAKLPEWDDYFRLLEIVKGYYDDIVVDLPEVVNPASRELVQRSRMVYLVSTPELLSLELAGRRMSELAEWNIPRQRVRMLLNRWSRGELGVEEAGREAGCPVGAVVPNDYLALRRALSKGDPAPPHSPVGKAYAKFAAELISNESPTQAASAGAEAGLLKWLFG